MKLRLDRSGFVALTVVLAVLVIGYAAVRTLSSNTGLRGAYRTAAGELVHQRVDRSVRFDHDVLLRSAFTNHWDTTRLGMPRHFPAYRVTWTGFLTVPEPAGETTLEPGLWRSIYADAHPDGRPIDVSVAENASFAAYNVDAKPAVGPYSIEWYGLLRIDEGGAYTFWTDSDDGSWLYVDGRLVVDNGGRHGLERQSGTIDLTAGLHPLRVRFNDLGGTGLLDVYWNPPGVVERQPIPNELLSRAAAGTAAHGLAIDSNVPFRIEVDGSELLSGDGSTLHRFSPAVEPGRHAVTLEISAPESSTAVHFRPGWFGAEGQVKPLPRQAFSLDERPSSRRLWADAGALLLTLGSVLLVWLVPACRRWARDYGSWLWRYRGALALIAIVLLAVGLRLYQYDSVPLFRETFDEFKTGWIGWTLLAEGEPSGWSLNPSGPGTYQETWLDLTFLIGKPKLHPPPLFPLMTGVASVLAGVDQMFDVSLPVIRLPAIACSVLVTILVYFLALRFYDRGIALVAALLHATIPNIVLAGRLAKEESLLAVLAVSAVLFVSIYLETGRKAWLYFSVISAGLAPLTKEIGFYIAVVVFLLLARERKWHEMARAIPVFTGCYLVYFAYCWWFAGDALSVVGGLGSAAFDGFGSVIKLFSTGRIVDRAFGSGWMIWLTLALMASTVRKNWSLVGPILSYVLVLGLTLNVLPDYGWYRIPLYPFLCVAGAVFVVDMARRPDLFRAVIFTVLALMTSLRYVGRDAFDSPWVFRWALFFALAPFALHFVLRRQRSEAWARGFAVLLAALFVLVNVRIVLNFLPAYLG